ncbi:hypothetical protein ElyMa_000514300 [Elysia marginata]|uniref:Uncharacterized protein n=1 Tax=Elysia marginata TaxID=1093978 RepID=A0AAV4FWE6_9GAST|nr:hypothetical protein ElyMa_000514300 [Elysia marginata]
MSTVFQGKVEGKRNNGRPPSSLAIKTTNSVARNFRRWSDLAKIETDGGKLRGHRCAVANTVPGDAESCYSRACHCTKRHPNRQPVSFILRSALFDRFGRMDSKTDSSC